MKTRFITYIMMYGVLAFFFVSEAKANGLRSLASIVESIDEDKVVVAIIDTGVDINHKDLKHLIWKNPGESGIDVLGNNKETNNIDDDGNGFIDDVHGWNFCRKTNKILDDHGHGTHIAGIIKNEIPKKSNIQFMVIKYYDPMGCIKDNISNTANSIDYAVKMKANIINYSSGGYEKSPRELVAIKKAQKNNILLVAAAGNEGANIDKNKYYPASYELDNIISVASLNEKGSSLSSFSNFGKGNVDIAARGTRVLSTLPNNKYGLMSGTSQATAKVSGMSARLLSSKKRLKISWVKGQLLSHSKSKISLQVKHGFIPPDPVFRSPKTVIVKEIQKKKA